MDATPLAQALGVTRRFGAFTAVDDIDLLVQAGGTVGLLGANGAGKTTLIRMLLGVLQPTAGEVRLFGELPSRATRRRLGFMRQGLGLYDDLTASQNLAFSAAVFGSGGHLPDSLQSVADTLVSELPLGLQRRVAFAATLGHHPDLLVLDEPTSGVDPLSRARLWDTIHTTAEAGSGVLVTTHSMDEAEECDRLVMLAGGRVVAAGTSTEITAGATVTVVETDRWADALAAVDAAGLRSVVVGRSLRLPSAGADTAGRALGALPVRIREEPATLEERFFDLVAAERESSVP